MMKNVCLKSKSSLFLTIATIVLALLLIMQILITAWLYPRPWRSMYEHPFLSDSEVSAAADALEKIFIVRSFRTRALLLNIDYNINNGKVEESYLKDHREINEEDLIIFNCKIFSPHTGGAIGWMVAMVRDSKGEWYIVTEGTLI